MANGNQCFMRWDDRVPCELVRGHVGLHSNHQSGINWWGQVTFDPQSHPRAGSKTTDPQVRAIPPDWADETNAKLWAAYVGDGMLIGNQPPARQQFPQVAPTNSLGHINRQRAPRRRRSYRLDQLAHDPANMVPVVTGLIIVCVTVSALVGLNFGANAGLATFAASFVALFAVVLIIFW